MRKTYTRGRYHGKGTFLLAAEVKEKTRGMLRAKVNAFAN